MKEHMNIMWPTTLKTIIRYDAYTTEQAQGITVSSMQTLQLCLQSQQQKIGRLLLSKYLLLYSSDSAQGK